MLDMDDQPLVQVPTFYKISSNQMLKATKTVLGDADQGICDFDSNERKMDTITSMVTDLKESVRCMVFCRKRIRVPEGGEMWEIFFV